MTHSADASSSRGLIWVTRPQPQAAETADALVTRGFTPLVAPLLSIESQPFQLPEGAALANGICFTSQAAPAQLRNARHLHDLPCYCVGERTAEAAHAVGFRRARAIAQDAKSMIATLASMQLQGQHLLYFSATQVACDLTDALAPHKIHITRIPVYRAVAASAFPTSVADVLPQLHAVLLYSPRTAQILMDLLPPSAPQLPCICISAAAAAPLTWPARIAHAPTQEAMLQMLDA
jgi:uroporphyrinogen-III synthase